jgi:hypothetical protein
MEPTIGLRFDPYQHQALSHASGSGRPADEIVAEFRRGYLVGDRVLRPALVAVSDGEEIAPEGDTTADGHGVPGSGASDTPRAN